MGIFSETVDFIKGVTPEFLKEQERRIGRVTVGADKRKTIRFSKNYSLGGVPLPNTDAITAPNEKWHAREIQAGLSTQIIVMATDVMGEEHVVGAIQTMTPTETRPLTRLSEIGNDTVVQTLPSGVFTVDIAVTRLVFDYQKLPAAFARGFRHIHAQRLPFDIVVIDYNKYREYGVPPRAAWAAKYAAGKVGDFAELFRTTDTDFVNLDRKGEAKKIYPKSSTADRKHKYETLDTGVGMPILDQLFTRYCNCWLTNYSYTYDQSNYLIAENATIWAETVQDEFAPPVRSDYSADVVEMEYNDRISKKRRKAIRHVPDSSLNPSSDAVAANRGVANTFTGESGLEDIPVVGDYIGKAADWVDEHIHIPWRP